MSATPDENWEEFVVLTSECPSDTADVLIDRLVANLWLREVSAGLPYELRVTAGSAAYDPTNPCSLGNLIRQADEDMRRRKGEPLVAAGGPAVNAEPRR